MEKVQIDVNDILRFMGIGTILLFLACYESLQFRELLKNLGGVPTVVFSFIVGNIFYAVYRSLIYVTIVVKLKDFMFKGRYYYRSYIKEVLQGASTKSAQEFFYFLREKRAIQSLPKESSSIHLMYMTSCILLLYGIYQLATSQFLLAAILTVFAIIIFVSAIYRDNVVEDYEFRQIRDIPLRELRELWERFKNYQILPSIEEQNDPADIA